MATQNKKHSPFETGHGKNVANLDKLIAVLLSFGTKYAPSSPEIYIIALQSLHTNLLSIIEQLSLGITPYVLAVDERQDAYQSMSKLATRILSMLKGSAATKRQIEDAKSIAKKLRSQSKSTIADAATEDEPLITSEETGLAPDAGNDTVNKVKRSVSQMGFDARIEHFNELVKLLSSIPKYNPNEAELTIAALNAYITSLAVLNHNVNITYSNLQKIRRERNTMLYAPLTGLLDLARQIRAYVVAVFGYHSPEAVEVNRIIFTQIK